jgi:type II secretory pathway pseudopilin PulG
MFESWKNTDMAKPLPMNQTSCQSTQSGFTLVEALIAVIISTVLLVAIAPLFVMSVSARVQARRIDLATQAARSYIDGLRANAIDPPTNNDGKFDQPDDLGVPAPTAMTAAAGIDQKIGLKPGNCLDKDLQSVDCTDPSNYLVIQAFRDGPNALTPAAKTALAGKGYCLGVRVYRADAFQGGSPTEVKPQAAPLGASKQYPLVVMKTLIINQSKFTDLQSRFLKNPNAPATVLNTKPNPCG